MATIALDELYERHIRQRPDSEKRRLLDLLLRDIGRSAGARRRWSDVRGIAPSPLLGEDAQQHVTRTRREDAEGNESGR